MKPVVVRAIALQMEVTQAGVPNHFSHSQNRQQPGRTDATGHETSSQFSSYSSTAAFHPSCPVPCLLLLWCARHLQVVCPTSQI